MNKQFIPLVFALAIQVPVFGTSICTVYDTPGFYQYGSDIIADPTDANDSVICITASDVILDFASYVISQQTGNFVTGLAGVTISPNVSNVTIRNGSIRALTGVGIIVGEGCSGIAIENISIIGCQESGIVINGVSVNHVSNVAITNALLSTSTGVGSNPTYGLRMIYSDNIEITQSTFIDNDAATSAAGYGISLENCSSTFINNCQISNNGGSNLGLGLSLYQCTRSRIQDTIVANTIARSATSEAVGFYVRETSDTLFVNCTSIGNNNSLDEAHGFAFIDGEENLCMQCLAQDNAGTTTASGFDLRGTENRSSLFKCKSRGNSGGVGGFGHGVLVEGAQTCDFWYNQLVGNTGNSGYGLVDTTINSNNLYAGNVAFKNTTDGFGVTLTLPNVFPVVSASIGDFSVLSGISKYTNISFF